MAQPQAQLKVSTENQLADDISQFYADPLGFVMYAYPWDTDSSIQLVKLEEPWNLRFNSEYGPDRWACELLDKIGLQVMERGFNGRDAVAAIQESVGSGHGIGKSAMTGWLVDWIMSTRPYAQGTVTANTSTQLETKTWAQIAKWTKMCITAHWFNVSTGRGSMKMVHKEHPESWFCSAQTCREENSEAFAGQHAANSTSFYINDEAAAIPKPIWEVQEGGLTDGEPMRFAFGNTTRNSGEFFETFGSKKHRWGTTRVDSRTVQITNKATLQQWVDDYGEDSDFVRSRIRGEFPHASDMQLIASDTVHEARNRPAVALLDDPLIVGIDIARGGADNSAIRARKGQDARSFPKKSIPGEYTRDTMRFVAVVTEYLAMIEAKFHRPDAIFIDATGIGGPVADRLRQMGYHVTDVQFGGKADNPKYADKATEMWMRGRDAIRDGLAIEDDADLAAQMTGREYHHDKKDRLKLEPKDDMKKRGLQSPDEVDALFMTYAYNVAPRSMYQSQKINYTSPHRGSQNQTVSELQHDFDPYK